MITREFNLYLHAGHSIPLVINVNQYDQGEQWLFTLFNADGTQYTPSSGAIVGIKSDNLGIINSGTVDSQGRVVINETQQMTAAVGKAVFELLIDDQSHGTANFVVLVEPKPGDNADLSESDLSLIQQAIDGTSAAAIAEGVTDWMDENLTPTTPVVDQSLTVQGAAADSKKVGDEISDLKSQISSLEAIPRSVKLAMDALFTKVMYIGDPSSDYATFHAWASAINVLSISAVFEQGSNIIYDNDSLDDLKRYLTVTANYDDGTSAIVNGYTLSGTLAEGTSTITVTYGEKTTTFNVTVTHWIINVDVSKFIIKATNTGKAPNYYSSANARLSYPYFDVLLDGGKTYKFTAVASINTAQIGVQAFNQNALNAVNAGNDFSATVGTGECYDFGWQNLVTVLELPVTQNSSPIVGARFASRASESNPTITTNYITSFTIEEVTE